MKSLRYLFVFISVMLLVACGGNDNALQDETLQEVKLKGFEELNLKDWGFNLIVMVPKADINGEPKIEQTEGGSLEVVVGLDFGIEIMYGEADLALLKMDLEEDLVFTSEIIKEEENAIIYTQDIPDSGVKTQNHFLFKAEVGADVFEIRDLRDGEYGAGMIEKMLEAVKRIKSSNIPVVINS